MKRILIIGGAVLLLIVLAAVFILRGFSAPLYKPGNITNSKYLESPLIPPPQPADSQYWKVAEDIQLFHFSTGTGKNVLVIHGGPGYPFLEPIQALDPLTTDYQFHYYDQRGSGKSTRPINVFQSKNYYQNTQLLEKRLGLTAQIADIERIRQILGEERIILIGHSFGGFLASLYAAEFPDHTEALILIAPANLLVMPQDDADLFELIRNNLEEQERIEYDIFMDEYFNFQDIFTKSEKDLSGTQQELGEFFLRSLDQPFSSPQGDAGGWMVWAMYFSMGQRHDYRDKLADITVPVLVIHGEDDFQTEATSQMYSDAFPKAQFQVIADAGHFVFEDRPEIFIRTISEFLDKLSPY